MGLLFRVVWEFDPQLLIFVGPLLKGQDHFLHRALVHWFRLFEQDRDKLQNDVPLKLEKNKSLSESFRIVIML